MFELAIQFEKRRKRTNKAPPGPSFQIVTSSIIVPDLSEELLILVGKGLALENGWDPQTEELALYLDGGLIYTSGGEYNVPG